MLDNIQLAKAKLALYAPEFISLTAKLEFLPDAKMPFYAGTDGRRVVFNPDMVATLTLPQSIGLVLHEVGHNMLAHPARLGNRNPQRANIAMDIALNYSLEEYFKETATTLKAEFPPGDLVPGQKWEHYKGWNWEKIYDDLEKKGGKCPDQFDNVTKGKNEDGSSMTPAQQEALAKEWTMAAQQAATMAKARGKQSAFFEEFVAGIIKPKVDWRSQLWDIFTKTAKEDQSWRSFNRKLIPFEIYMPGMYSEVLGPVVFAVDTSASMDSQEFKIALGAQNELFETVKPEKITFIQCDTEIKSVEELTIDDLPIVTKDFKGRGGTILTPIFERIRKLEEPPELVAVLTDGEHEEIAKELEPDCPVVWLVTTDSTRAAENSFGKVIRVEV